MSEGEGNEFKFSLQDPNAYEKALDSHIQQCFLFCSQLGVQLEWGISETKTETDGVTRFTGWFKVLAQSTGDLRYSDDRFQCAVTSYFLSLPNIDDDFVFRGCVARQVLTLFGFS